MEENITPEKYFFRFAFPCSHIILQKGKITQEEFDDLKKMFLNNQVPDKRTLEMVFKTAFMRIKKLSLKMNKDIWDIDVIKEYWEKEHNKLIDYSLDGYEKFPDSFKKLCKINITQVVKKNGNILIVKDNDNERVVFSDLVKDVKVGDKVRIHYAYAIEKIN